MLLFFVVAAIYESLVHRHRTVNIDVNPFTQLVNGCVQPSVHLFFYLGNKGHWLEDVLSTCVNCQMFHKLEELSGYTWTNALFVILSFIQSCILCQKVFFILSVAAACNFITAHILYGKYLLEKWLFSLMHWIIEINCHVDANSTLSDLQQTKMYRCGFFTTEKSIHSCYARPNILFSFFSNSHLSVSYPLTPFLLSPLSPLPIFSRAVMGLDRESDVVHIETRITKGREC